jgi:hypothetical protein
MLVATFEGREAGHAERNVEGNFNGGLVGRKTMLLVDNISVLVFNL